MNIRILSLSAAVVALAAAPSVHADAMLSAHAGKVFGGDLDGSATTYGGALTFMGNGPFGFEIEGAYTSDFFGKDPNYVAYKKYECPEFAEVFGVDDFAAAFIRLEGGIILDFRIAWAMNLDTAGDTIIYGTKGSLRIPSTECWNGTIGGDLVIADASLHEAARSKPTA